MREYERGDVAVRLQFGRVYGSGPDRGQVRPALEVTDQMSGKILTIDLSAIDLAELMAGGAADVPAARVTGFGGMRDWGKEHQMTTRTVKTESGDWKVKSDREIAALPHIAPVLAELREAGYRPDSPRRNNQGVWVIIGRRYVDKP